MIGCEKEFTATVVAGSPANPSEDGFLCSSEHGKVCIGLPDAF